MSELVNARDNRATIRWKLLTGASALALTGYISSTALAKAEDSGHPVLWLDLGGQFQQLTDPSETWVPANLPPVIDHPVAPAANQTPRIGYDASAGLTFQPEGSDWSFSASIKYGKAKRGPKFAHDQTYKTKPREGKYVITTYAFTNLHAVEETKHLILDFSAGEDVGIGLFGSHASSDVKFGIRIAQFHDRSDGFMTAQTSVPAKYAGSSAQGKIISAYVHSRRSFDGAGPSIAWNSAVPIVGSMRDGLTIDWGANAAFLFGRQKTKVTTHNQKIGYVGFTSAGTHLASTVITNATRPYSRAKHVTVPNLGGIVALSFRKGNAKVSFGYKADFFFNAIDGGIATRKTENRGFYGPFATLSVGLGR